MKRARLVLTAERLTELSYDEMSAVNGGASIVADACLVVRYPSDWKPSICECITRTCG
jgi:hypothetical protein